MQLMRSGDVCRKALDAPGAEEHVASLYSAFGAVQ